MSDWIYLLIAISGVNLLVLAGVLLKAGGYLSQLDSLVTRHAKCPIATLETSVAVMRRENDIIWKSLSINLSDVVREHTQPNRDELIDKMNQEVATADELRRLYTLLRNDLVESRSEKPIPHGRLVALAVLVARVEQKIYKEESSLLFEPSQ